MLGAIQAPLLFGLFAAFVTTIGLVFVARQQRWSEEYAKLFAVAAGGMLLTLVVVHIAPEALERSSQAPVLIASGFLGGLALNVGLRWFSTRASGQVPSAPAMVAAPVLAIAIHSFFDGIIYAVTFATSFEAGVFAALSLSLHEFPEGVIAFALLRQGGVSSRYALLFAFLASAATTPLGVIASAPVVFSLSSEVIGNLFAVSAGLLLFVATGPLMAPLRSQPLGRGSIALAIGVIFALGLTHSPLNAHRHADTVGFVAVTQVV
ncbi:MAG: ZIP family metal transporter [Pseudomonadota bacterium]